MLRSPQLTSFDWLEHGFGERTDTLESLLGTIPTATAKQIHSNICFAVESPGLAGSGDALLTGTPELAVAIRTADCLPILLADPVTRSVAAIHAGWRGTVAHIAPAAVANMRETYGAQAGDIVAAIGPGIGACCYEVGEEVAREFGHHGRAKIDLAAVNRQLLIGAGVLPEKIQTAGLCTFCHDARFWSWRRQKEQAGRMVSFVRVLRERAD